MKKSAILIAVIVALAGPYLWGQDIAGQWHGALEVMGNSIPLVFHFERHGDVYRAKFDSPSQQAVGIPFTSVRFHGSAVSLRVANNGIHYEGRIREDTIVGTWSQSGRSFPLTLSREPVEVMRPDRPQEPVGPLPYREEEVRFRNDTAGLDLVGTLTLPETGDVHPAVILVSGSGAQNRDQEIFGHRPFLVLADYLTKRGIAVLRYDDRGTAESTGNFDSATTRDFAEDVRAAVSFLSERIEIDSQSIGLVGHSEGAIVAPMAATHEGGMSQSVAFLVLLAGPAIPGNEVALMQANSLQAGNAFAIQDQSAYRRFNERWIQIATTDHPMVQKRNALTQLMRDSRAVLQRVLPDGTDIEFYIRQQVGTALSPWMQFFYNHDPADDLERLTIPVLALYGSRDVQVDPQTNIEATRQALGRAGNQNATVLVLDGLNHMFQDSETGLVEEYSTIEQTFSPRALDLISRWILSIVAP